MSFRKFNGPYFMRLLGTLFFITLLFLIPGQVLAQNTGNTAETEQENETPAKPKIRVLPPAYDKQMMRLSEVLGALHYLRELCGADEGQLWRGQMEELIRKEEPTDERRAQMTARFNQGFRGFQETYRECTPVAIEANNRYLAEGAKLALDIPSRFGR